ncbi:hypothetical protein K439DRAFT_1347295, partial [Ramaria rubella]
MHEGPGLEDDIDGFVDETSKMSAQEREVHADSVHPVCLVLVKLWKIAFKLINSPTKLLPAWHRTLADLKPSICIMPHNVATRWNSTYNMLVFVMEYQKALKLLTGD